jgi:hypothetical protein
MCPTGRRSPAGIANGTPRRYPANDLIELYHRRWQAETTYLSIKSTMLDGRVLRSQYPTDIDQEVYALLTVYQTIIRIAVDAVDTCPEARPDRISFTVALQTAADQVTAAVGIIIPAGDRLVGVIGQAVLDELLPAPATEARPAPARTRPASTARTPAASPDQPQLHHQHPRHDHERRLDGTLKALTQRCCPTARCW